MNHILKEKGNTDKQRVRADEGASARTCCLDGHWEHGQTVTGSTDRRAEEKDGERHTMETITN